MKNFVLFTFLIFVLSSCVTTSRTVRTAARQINASGSNIVQKPLIGDVKVDLTKKISATITVPAAKATNAKEQANQLALDQNNFDIMIDPVYDITYSGANANVTVIGYGAKYTNIETASESDVQVLYDYNMKKWLKEMEQNGGQFSTGPDGDFYLFIVNDINTKFKNRNMPEFIEVSAINQDIYKSYKGIDKNASLSKEQNLEFMWLLQYDIQNYKLLKKGKSPLNYSREDHVEKMKKTQKAAKAVLLVEGLLLVIILIGVAAG